jgi:GalNAc-alpha-(1->4)-GalNAc-alpha-(1->3)-diNAcBac-PP-undecaprenol alpha-1,4-N-acetyl-D-galactosaminyltransferase
MKKTSKIAILLVARNIGGMEKRFSYLLKYLMEKKVDDILFDFYISKTLASKIGFNSFKKLNKNINVILYGNKFESSRFFHRALDYIDLYFKLSSKTFKYDSVHFVNPSSLKFRRILKPKNRVHSFFNSAYVEDYANSPIYFKIRKNKFRIDCLDNNIKKQLENIELFNNHVLYVSPCSFIDYSKIHPSDFNKKNVITFCGRLIDIKGLEILLPAIKDCVLSCPEINFKIIGDGPLKDSIKEFIAKNQLQDNVELFYSTNPIDEFNSSKIFLSLQKFENYPSQSLLEAMACSNAVIATNVGVTKTLIDENVGVLINYDSEELKIKILELFYNEKLTKTLGYNAREKVIKEHTVSKFYDYLMKIHKVN